MSAAPTAVPSRLILPVLVYCGLCTAVISSLGVLLIPTIAAAQEVSLPAAQWILTVALLVGAVGTPVLGRLADRGHPRRVLLGTLAAVAVGSLLAATAPNFGQLLLGRALQGLTFAIIPVTMALARAHLPAERARAGVAALSVTAATGIGLGYPITGAVAEYLDYRVAFWIAVVFAGSALVLVPLVIPGSPGPPPARVPFDVLGTVLFAGGLGCGLLALSESERWGWGSPAVLGLFGAGGTLLAAWVWWELRTPQPLVRLDLLRHSDVRLAQLTGLGFGMAMFAAFAATSQLAQLPESTGYGLGLTAFAAGFVILPLSLGSQLSSRLARPLARRLGDHAVLPLGAAAVAAANVGLIWHHDETWELLVAMALLGIGIGVALSAMPTLILGAAPPEEMGSAIALNQVLRTVGGSIASAAIAAVLAANSAGGVPTDDGYRLTFAISAGMSAALLGWLVVAAVRSRPSRPVRIDAAYASSDAV